MTSDSTPAFEIEKEALKTEIETGIQAGVDHLEAKTAKRKDADKYHNTRHLLKQYRKVAYAIQISEADMNVRMEMEHGTRLSTLEVNAELAGVDLSGSRLEGYARTVIRSKNMLQIIDNALSVLLNYLRYIEPGEDSNKWRWPMMDYWLELVEDAEKISIYQAPGMEYNEERCKRYVVNQAGNAIDACIQMYGLYEFERMIQERPTARNPKYEVMIRQHHFEVLCERMRRAFGPESVI